MIKGRYQAEFFRHFEFPVVAWQDLVATLRQHALDHEATKEENSPFGKRYLVEGIRVVPQ